MRSNEGFVFGLSAKKQIGQRLRAHIETHFETFASAAQDLGITKQRLSLYTTGKSLPRAEIIDRVKERWGLSLLGAGQVNRKNYHQDRNDAKRQLLLLFEKPVSFGDDALKVIVQRKGNSLVASLHFSADLKVG